MNAGRRKLDFPQGLKPYVCAALCGTAEAVPFQNVFIRPFPGAPGKHDRPRPTARLGEKSDSNQGEGAMTPPAAAG
jgi:hypothetical protein